MGLFLQAAEITLRRKKNPMNVREITNIALESRDLDFSNGLTPHQTMKAKISVDIRLKGNQSIFKRTAPGIFALREWSQEEYVAIPWRKRIKPEEYVLVIPSKLLKEIGLFQGIEHNFNPYFKKILNLDKAYFVPRISAESDSSYKQILSYVIIKHNDKILRFQRGSYSNVTRFLKGRYCIGFGGHVKGHDFNLMALDDKGYFNSVVRELNEELNLPIEINNKSDIPIIGILNDDSSEVGQRHVAFIHLLEIDSEDISKNEKSINQLKLIPISELSMGFELYEYWSRLCIKNYFSKNLNVSAIYKENKKNILNGHEKYIIIVGSIGSGKTVICSYVQKKYGYNVVSSGNVLKQILNISMNTNRDDLQDISYNFIKTKTGPKVLAENIIIELKRKKTPCIIDGIRNIDTYNELKTMLNEKLPVIYIETGPDDAYRFFRLREDENLNYDNFVKLLAHPVESELPSFAEKASVVFYNQGDLTSYHETIDEYFKKVIK